MTSFADLTIMQHFSGVFVFFLVFIVVYALLQLTNLFKNTEGSKGICAMISLVIAFIASLSEGVFTAITTMTPWFAALIIFIFLVMFVIKIFTGPDEEFFSNMIKNKPGVYITLIIIFAVILIGSVVPAVNTEEGSTDTKKDNNSATTGTTTIIKGDSDNETVVYQRSELTGSTEQKTNTSQSDSPDTLGDQVLQTILHPQILGVLLLFFIAGFAVLLLSRTPASK